VLSLASFPVILAGGAAEPYVEFKWTDALVQVFLGIFLLTLWLEYTAALLFMILSGVISRWWWLSVVWAAVVVFYLSFCPIGYISDLAGLAK
jgi:hypothetical protein